MVSEWPGFFPSNEAKKISHKQLKQGQGNQCQTPGVKFEELTGWKKGKNGKKLEETGRKGETEEKTRPKVKTMAYLFFTLLIC